MMIQQKPKSKSEQNEENSQNPSSIKNQREKKFQRNDRVSLVSGITPTMFYQKEIKFAWMRKRQGKKEMIP